ncbi:E3 ubiquitin-protein ligase TRAIP-like [Chelonus insularis]|uniref:E3 ubiquitin-protein ligase TRAIP-like n=1 Tax=Chelonus insularis TaxID=460826 RepID=UPI0015889424|nr:E3 ubiquitin-protein ligase TRAIP-like [Chelonus insularis]
MALCSICLSSITSGQIDATECGHVFHHQCLHTWYDKNQNHTTCPSCRHKIYWSSIKRLHLDFGEDMTPNNSIVEDLHQNVISMSARLKDIEQKLASTEKNYNTSLKTMKIYQEHVTKLNQENAELKATTKLLKEQLTQQSAISMSAKLREVEQKLTSTEKKVHTLLKTKEVYQERAAKSKQEIIELKATIKNLNKQLTQEIKHRKFYENECLALTAQVNELENDW